MLRTLLLVWSLLIPALAWAGPNTLAVLYFENSGSGDYDALKVGLAQMLITDLVPTEGVTVVERAQLQAILDELELGHKGFTDPATAAKVGKLLGAEWMVMGSYFEMGGMLYVQSRIVKVETGELLDAFSLQDRVAGFLDIEKELAKSYSKVLGELVTADGGTGTDGAGDAHEAPAPTGATRGGGAGTATEDATTTETAATTTEGSSDDGVADTLVATPDADAVDAAIAFSEGLIYLDSKDVSRAREAFERAVTADPRLDDAKEQLAALDL